MAKYGYTGAKPTQSDTANTGVFGVNDMVELLNKGKFKLQTVDMQYLVIAGGGGGGGPAGSASGTGGGGAGGYRNSYASETSGGSSSTESVLAVPKGSSITVTVGAGGSANASGNDSVFHTITSIKGGLGGQAYDIQGTYGSGGGSGSYTATTTAGGLGTAGQGTDGGNGRGGNTNNIRAGGGGGGAGTAGEHGQDYDAGVGGNGLSSSITGSAVTRAGGGGGAGPASGNTRSGGSGGAGSSANNGGTGGSATVNTGSGGGSATGTGGTPGTGGSGIVILRWATADASIGATRTGLTDGGVQTDGSDSYIVFTAGTGTVTFS